MTGYLRKIDIVSIFLRSLLFQVSWNFERMQNMGFLYIIKPVLDRIYDSERERREAYLRHMGFFNTHPYLVNPVIGLVAREEESLKTGNSTADRIYCLKSQLGGPLAAIGDIFFWATWRPLTALLCICFYFLLKDYVSENNLLLFPAAFIILYNVPHFYVRWAGFLYGYYHKDRFIEIVKSVYSKALIENLSRTGFMVLGVLAIYLMFKVWHTQDERIMAVLIFMISAVFSHKGINPTRLFIGYCLVFAVMRLIGLPG